MLVIVFILNTAKWASDKYRWPWSDDAHYGPSPQKVNCRWWHHILIWKYMIFKFIIPRFILLRKTSIGQGMTILHILKLLFFWSCDRPDSPIETTWHHGGTDNFNVIPQCYTPIHKSSAYMTQIIRNQVLFYSESPFATPLFNPQPAVKRSSFWHRVTIRTPFRNKLDLSIHWTMGKKACG